MAKIISVVNQKGGVGKTTTTVNLAASLAGLGKRVLIIDFDPQGHSTEHLGVKAEKGKTALELLNKEGSLTSLLYPTYVSNLWILPTNLRLGQFNQNSPVGRQFALKEGIREEVKNRFDYVIIDCQPSLSLLTLNALVSCDKVLLPVQAEFLALDGLSQLIVTLKEIQTKLHPKLSVLGVLLTMYDKRNKLSFEVKEELQKNFREDIFDIVIPRNVKLAEAPSFGQSILDYAGNSSGAVAYRALAKEVIKKLN
ncbi:ParA family protein [Candidatus Gracilibacteria bacterium]|nr:ParA family protein [Thermales bacterium]NJL96371.1 ParA family protein [Candidatus Gracilibacteria bacterium]NJS41831.1 ParA family protein [Candidatus Gracilibacteria bacterium]